MTMKILAVCTGNICRSPVFAHLLEDRTDDTVTVSSAGVRARAGDPIAPGMTSLLQSRGIDSSRFVAQQLTPEMIRTADVVVTMTRAQRGAVVRAVPESVRRTFTLLELAHVLSTSRGPRDAADDAARWTQVPELVSRERQHHSARTRELDVEDPWGRGDKAYRRSFDRIVTATDTVCGVLGTGRQPWLVRTPAPRIGTQAARIGAPVPPPRHSTPLGRS